jgi:predicted esterase
VEWLQGDLELGFQNIYLHNVGRNQQEFIEVFGERVLPALR